MSEREELGREMVRAVTEVGAEVRGRRFPGAEHCYAIEPGELELFRASLRSDA